MVSCTLRLGRSRIQTLSLIDCGASGYAFIDKKFAQTNQIPLHPLKYARRLEGFDGQPALTGNITHAAEVIMDLNGHTKKMFLFVTGLRTYPIVLGHPWLRRHQAHIDFNTNSLSLESPFCLAHCSPRPVTVQAHTEEEFLSPAESQEVWKSEEINPASIETSIETSTITITPENVGQETSVKEEMKDVSRIEKAIEQGNSPKIRYEAPPPNELRSKDAPLSKKSNPQSWKSAR